MTPVVHHMFIETASCPQQPVSLGVDSEAGTGNERELRDPQTSVPIQNEAPYPYPNPHLISSYEKNCEEDQLVLSQSTCLPGFLSCDKLLSNLVACVCFEARSPIVYIKLSM